MPKVKWRNWLQAKPTDMPRDIMQQQRKWNMKFEIRKRAQQAMDDLTLIFEQLRKVSRHPGRDFAIIFQDESRLFKLLAAMEKAYELSIDFKLKLFDPKHLPILQDVLSRAGMGYYSKTQLKDRRLRHGVLEQLKQKETEDGSYYEDVWRQIRGAYTSMEIEYEIERSRKLVAFSRKEPRDDFIKLKFSDQQWKALLNLSEFMDCTPEDLLMAATNIVLDYHMRESKNKFADKRSINFPSQSFVEVSIPEEDWKKIKLWGKQANISFVMGPHRIVIMNNDLTSKGRGLGA